MILVSKQGVLLYSLQYLNAFVYHVQKIMNLLMVRLVWISLNALIINSFYPYLQHL